jgi:hypothetical protein
MHNPRFILERKVKLIQSKIYMHLEMEPEYRIGGSVQTDIVPS